MILNEIIEEEDDDKLNELLPYMTKDDLSKINKILGGFL